MGASQTSSADAARKKTMDPGVAKNVQDVGNLLKSSLTMKRRARDNGSGPEPRPKLPESKVRDLGEKRVVEVSMTLMAVYSVDDKEHEFEALVSVHLRYDPTPLYKDSDVVTVVYDGSNVPDSKLPTDAFSVVGKPFSYYPDWYPEISMLNAREVEELEHIPGGAGESSKKQKKGDKMEKITISKHYEATFIKSLNLEKYPFDSQELEIVVVGDNESYLTHMMDRKPSGNPKTSKVITDTHRDTEAPHLHIKAVMDDDTLTEWETLEWNETRGLPSKFGQPVPVVSSYSFKEVKHGVVGDASKGEVDESFTTTRLEFKVYVHRRWVPIFMATILPMGILSAASMVVFCMEITANQGNRFGALFTIVLTIVANTIILDANLPKLPYLTWVDQLLLELTLFVYWIIVESAAVVPIAYGIEGAGNVAAADKYDNVGFWISLALYLCIMVQSFVSATVLLVRRTLWARSVEHEARKSMALEEMRNAHWGIQKMSEFFEKHLAMHDKKKLMSRWGIEEEEDLGIIVVSADDDKD